MFGTAAITLAQVRAGRLKALGVSTARRSPLLPDVPTISESGAPGYEMSIWWGVLAPAHTPPAVAGKLHAEFSRILKEPASAERLAAEGAEPSTLAPIEFTRLLSSEVDKWKRVAREANIKAD
jgi:tripartite-type tricarboxylate transporter receptor subunit TctC